MTQYPGGWNQDSGANGYNDATRPMQQSAPGSYAQQDYQNTGYQQQGYQQNYQTSGYQQSSQNPQNGYQNQYSGEGKNPQQEPKKKYGTGVVLTAALLAALVGGGVGAGVGGGIAASTSSNSSSVTGRNAGGSATNPTVVTDTAKKVLPSTVTVGSKLTDGNGVGTGEVLDNQGHILTNNHVVSTNGTQQSSRVEVRLHDGSIRVAKIVGTDVTSDLAVIKIDPSGLDLKPITFGDSSKVVPGETVVALGSPHNLQDTVTAGVISNTDRAAEAEKDGVYIPMIQTDAPVNHGNSGGPLVNSSGALVGINSQIESEGGGNEGIAYAVPSNYAKRISDEIISKGKATHGYLGANIESAPGQTNEGESRFFPDGVRVTNISSGSPAEKAGLQKGDVIVEADGHRIEQSKTLNGVVRAQAAGATVDMKIKRGSETKNIKVTLGDADNQH